MAIKDAWLSNIRPAALSDKYCDRYKISYECCHIKNTVIYIACLVGQNTCIEKSLLYTNFQNFIILASCCPASLATHLSGGHYFISQ